MERVRVSFLPGFLRSRVSPTSWIDSRVLADAAPAQAFPRREQSGHGAELHAARLE
jgi:hypothetical protein